MANSTFATIARTIIYVNAALSYLMNLTLIYFIVFHSRKHMGAYRYLMLLFSGFNLLYPVVHIVVMPNMHVYGRGFVLMPNSLLENTMLPAHWGMVLYGSFFSQSLAFLAFHFVYRYLLICKTNWLFIFNSFKYFPLHFGIWLSMGIVWGTILHIYMYHTKTLMDYFREPLREIYGYDVDTSAIMGLLYKHPNEVGEEVWDWGQLFAFTVCIIELGSTFGVILFCTWRIHETLKTAAMSEASRRLERQFFRALLVQTIIPLIFEYIPCALTFLTPLVGIPFGRGCNLVPIAITFYPILDPMSILYFIKDYRYALMGKLGFSTAASEAKEDSTRRNSSIYPI